MEYYPDKSPVLIKLLVRRLAKLLSAYVQMFNLPLLDSAAGRTALCVGYLCLLRPFTVALLG